MSIASLKHDVDELAGTASDLKQERNDRIGRSLAIMKRRIGSPLGLAVCFSAGFLTGARAGHADEPDQHVTDRSANKKGSASKILLGPVVATAIKMALAFMTQKPGNSSFGEPE